MFASNSVAISGEGDPVDSLKAVIAFHVRDWSLEQRDAWIYGIVIGWGAALPDVAKVHKWSQATVSRLGRLHDRFEKFEAKEKAAAARRKKKEPEKK